MPADDDYTDDHVAELLRRDARATSSAASNLGLGSLLSKRPTGAAPKPNTRFLKNLIRDTDSHNAALLAKEADESRARLRKLREQERKTKGRPEQTLYSARARRDGGHAIPPPSKRQRLSDERDDKRTFKPRHGQSHRAHQDENVPRERERHHREERTSHRRTRHEEDEDKYARDRRKRSGNRTRERSRSKSPSYSDDHRHESSNRRRDRSRTRRRHRSRSPEQERERERHRRTHRHRHTSPPRNHGDQTSSRRPKSSPDGPDPALRDDHSPPRVHARQLSPSSASDSDPLDAFLGPAPPPPVRSKGRGAFAPSAIDSHFASTYDPATDVQPDQDAIAPLDDDWDSALEALRDRQKWRQQGAERLRAAGFTEDEVAKWENTKLDRHGERVMDEADVKWNKAGEGREWDRGKVIDDDDQGGSVQSRPEWGRLKGT